MRNSIAKEKAKDFAIRIVNLYKHLCFKKQERILSKQLLRSGTNIGANLCEAENGISENDFLAKVYIALKEAAETQYWLELLYNTQYLSECEFNSIADDCVEIIKILKATTKTMKNKKSHL